MTRTLGVHPPVRRLPATLLTTAVAAALVLTTALVGPLGAAAATPLTVAQATGTQDGSTATVRGYVVGQPTATSTVVRSGFPNDYAFAIADSPGETNTDAMIYVQVPSAFRDDWGLQSNPDLLGARVDVTGALTAYFAHPGLKNGTAFALAEGSDPGDPGDPPDPGDGTESPWDDTYYAPAIGKTGDPLRDALHAIIDDHTTVSYSTVWTALKQTDADPDDSDDVVLLYSGRTMPASSNGGGVDDWNREHVWPKSHGDFGTRQGPGTDLHHLRPTDVTVNSSRGNKDFDEGGSPVHQCSLCLTDGDSFEPPDAVKGDVARMVFYMAIRYEGDDGFADLELNDAINGTTPWLGRLSELLAWNAQDPVSAAEMRRNDLIHSDWQGNRNPFIDHPEWADLIWTG